MSTSIKAVLMRAKVVGYCKIQNGAWEILLIWSDPNPQHCVGLQRLETERTKLGITGVKSSIADQEYT